MNEGRDAYAWRRSCVSMEEEMRMHGVGTAYVWRRRLCMEEEMRKYGGGDACVWRRGCVCDEEGLCMCGGGS
ncbi:unnamed protein product, partial [Nesidiocoris tenuis]